MAMLLNVFVPHLPATLIFYEYTPRVVTAVLVNLPVMTWLLVGAVREGWVSGRRVWGYAVAIPVGLAVGIAALFAAASR